MRLCINNGLIVDPENNLEAVGDILIEDGYIKEIRICNGEKPSHKETSPGSKTVYINARGKWVVPGLIDLHVHLREPGFEYKESIASGCRAAAKGGFTTICCMPNTNPAIDRAEVVSFIEKRADLANGVHVYPVGAVTKGQEGIELADFEEMINTKSTAKDLFGKAICGISEDGKTVQNEEIMIAAMKAAKEIGFPVFSHAEPEEVIVKRDIKLAKASGCKLHFCHISLKKSIELIREAKKSGINVTAETAPHYFTLDQSQVKGDTNKKMNPPLREREDVDAVKEALKDGTLDIIATDHAPHNKKEKEVPFEKAANGVTGLETSFQVSFTKLVKTGILTPIELISKMSTKPADILGIARGSLSVGSAADIAIIDIEKEYEIGSEKFLSKGKNSPFKGMKVFGKIAYTIIDGEIVYGGEKE